MSFTPTDLILLRGIKEGIAWMRANPYILDWVFERLIEEAMDLQKTYGQQEINRAKSWFLKNNIDVRMAYNLDGVPSIGIGGVFLTSPGMATRGEQMPEVESGRRALILTDILIKLVPKA